MHIHPIKKRKINSNDSLLVDSAGGFFSSNDSFIERLALENLSKTDKSFLLQNGHAFEHHMDLDYLGFVYRRSARRFAPQNMNYLILVPTLRCNLACSYCQVSRVNEQARGFDWDNEVVEAVLSYIDQLDTTDIKIEFQGGEPLLALSHLERVREFCRQRFDQAEFVVCTNLQSVSDESWAFLSASDTSISTSFDGSVELHQQQRTVTPEATQTFIGNLTDAIKRFGIDKVSALPTLDPRKLPDPNQLIRNFALYGFRSIYLRPINYQGLARKRHGQQSVTDWNNYYFEFLDCLVEYNDQADEPIEEYYFSHCLRRIFRFTQDNHVDLRNPNILGSDYLVIDYDGTFYPTDEARMVTRVGQIDLSIGSVVEGIDQNKLATLNREASNDFKEGCIDCVYQAYCGVDLIDDLSRYGRIDHPKHLTDFCRRHLAVFDKAFSMIYSSDPKVHRSLATWLGLAEFNSRLAPTHK